MKAFVIGLVIMVLVAIATPLLGLTGWSREVCAGVLIYTACVGFMIQLAGIFSEKSKLDALDMRFRYEMAMWSMLRRNI